MKLIFIIALLTISNYVDAQVIQCTSKVNEIGMWQQTDTKISVDSSFITLIEYPGITTIINYDTQVDDGVAWTFYYQGIIRAVFAAKQENPVFSIVGKHFLCPKSK